jgi:nicotinamidase-related amidase
VLKAGQAVLVVVDVQGKLAQLMHEKDELFRSLSQLVRGARVLRLPVIWMEQNPDGLGPTVPEVAGAMPEGLSPIPKFSFSCCGEPRFVAALEAAGRRQVLLCGIEAHICVYQTARDLVAKGYEVFVAADAVSSRKASSRDVALTQMGRSAAQLTTVEMALFEMLGVAKGPEFKEIVRIVK